MAKTLYFRDEFATSHRGTNTAKLAGAASFWTPRALGETRGSGAVNILASSIAGTTVGIEFTGSPASAACEFISEPLSADFTIAGTITGNMWAAESTMNDNTAINFVVDKIDGATGAITQIAKSARIVECAVTTPAVNNFTVTPANLESTVASGTPAGSNFSLGLIAGSLIAQSFIAYDAAPVSSVLFAMLKIGTPTDGVLMTIQADNAGAPSGTALATSATIAASSITTSLADYTFSFASPPALTVGAKYWIVLSRSGAADGSNYYQSKLHTSDVFTNGEARSWGGSSWLTPQFDMRFQVFHPVRRGDRIRIRPFIDDIGSAMIVGTTTFRYNGPTAAASGDSYITFTENLTFEPTGDPGVIDQPLAGSSANVGLTTIERQAQPFVAAEATLTEVKAWLRKIGAPSDNLIGEIQTDNAGSPSGTVVSTFANVSMLSIPTVSTEYTWSIAMGLTKGTTYWLVWRRNGSLDSGNYAQLATNADASPGKVFSSGAWAARTNGLQQRLTFTVSTYYLTDTAESINPGSATEKKALTTRGSGSTTAVTNTATGPTVPIQITASGGGTAVEWYTPSLDAFTLGGKALMNLRGYVNTGGGVVSLHGEIAVCNADGSGAVVWGATCIEADWAYGEYGQISSVTDSFHKCWVSGDDVAVTAGQRLRFRVYIDDTATVQMNTGFTATVSYAGTSAAAAGDTYVILPVAVTEQSVGGGTEDPMAYIGGGYYG